MIEADVSKVVKMLDELSKGIKTPPVKMLNQIGEYAKTAIKARTAQGKDVNESPFKGYSSGYKAIRAKAGRPINKVDLHFTGKMLAAMTHKSEPGASRVVLFFNSADESEKAFENQKTRKFFGLNEKDNRRIMQIVLENLRIGKG